MFKIKANDINKLTVKDIRDVILDQDTYDEGDSTYDNPDPHTISYGIHIKSEEYSPSDPHYFTYGTGLEDLIESCDGDEEINSILHGTGYDNLSDYFITERGKEFYNGNASMYVGRYYDDYLDTPNGREMCKFILEDILDAQLDEDYDNDDVIEIY